MRYAKGVMWLDDCRIPFVDEETTTNHNTQPGSFVGSFGSSETIYKENTQGRFTPNLLVCDDVLNDGVITKQSKRTYKPTEHNGSLFGNSPQAHGVGIGDKGTNSRYYDLDRWFNQMIGKL